MSDLLLGKALHWISWDESSVVTAMLHQRMREHFERAAIKVRYQQARALGEVADLAANQVIGFVLWRVAAQEQIAQVCESIHTIRSQGRGAVRVCFLAPSLPTQAGLLVESGAQILVSQLPSLVAAIPKLIQAAPLSNHGFHPLTSGLVQRLPWSNV